MTSRTWKQPVFIAVFVLTAAASISLAFFSSYHEAASIPIMLPLIWAYMILSIRGMIVSGLLAASIRITVEVIYDYQTEGLVELATVGAEVVFPLGLYAALSIPFYLYRRQQERLVRRMIEVGNLETSERLSSSLAQDFGRLLELISISARRLLEDRSLSLSSAQNANTIMVLGNQGADLIRQMRQNCTHHTGDSMQHKPSLCDLNDVVDRQMDLLTRVLEPDVHVERHLAHEPIPIRLDVSDMLRVLINLCQNSRAAMLDGGTVSINTALVTHHEQLMAKLVFSDTGSGMDPYVQEHLFEPFFTTHGDEGHIGLGLGIVQSIVRYYGGTIEVVTAPGQGSSFTIMLPVKPQNPAATAA